ncbi:glycosyltransferase family 25 protein [Fangia hongkongensis]|nr:glycosyltransferase family 25 protein [Fangia hongkongensis]
MRLHNIPFKWMLKGDIKDIDNHILSQFFSPAFTTSSTAVASCCYKHYLVWQAFLHSDYQYCLVFEDDVFLAPDFVKKFMLSIEELERKALRKVSIQYSNAANQYTAKSKIRPHQHLYANHGCRATDAYLITKETAELRCNYIEKYKFTHPADWQTNIMDNNMSIQFLWFEPTIVEQGTQAGKFPSIIQKNKYPLWVVKIKWQIKKFFRQRK